MSLPSSSALEALLTLSRTGSITRTADALALSHSAVSHKLKTLERALGFRLTERDGRGVVLTRRARQYVEDVAPALEAIRRASARGARASGPLTVSVAGGFAANWLCWRLREFTALHPDVTLRINTPRGYGDLGQRDDDLYITFARPDEVPEPSQHLLDVSFFPVAAPSLVHQGRLRHPPDVLDHTLLHLETRTDWAAWLEEAGMSAGGVPPGILFQDFQVMTAATRAAQGISLGDGLTTSAALERGELVRPFSHDVTVQRSYFLVEGASPPTPRSHAFRRWLVDTIAQDRPLRGN